jgi:hypothetical protein
LTMSEMLSSVVVCSCCWFRWPNLNASYMVIVALVDISTMMMVFGDRNVFVLHCYFKYADERIIVFWVPWY